MYDEVFFRCEDQLLVSDKEMDAKDKHIQQCTKTQEERKNELVRQLCIHLHTQNVVK